MSIAALIGVGALVGCNNAKLEDRNRVAAKVEEERGAKRQIAY